MPSIDDQDEFLTGPRLIAWYNLNTFRVWMQTIAFYRNLAGYNFTKQLKAASETLIEQQDYYDRWLNLSRELR